MKKYKLISKISLVLLLAMMLNMAMIPGLEAARLTSAKDTMTRTQVSGTGTATKGYTESTATVTSGFVFTASNNEDIAWNYDGAHSGTVADLITSGGLIAGDVYTGAQVATAIKKALEATDVDPDDVYTVTWKDETDETFTFYANTNEDICFDPDGTVSFNATCTGTGNVKVDLITDGGLTAGTVYAGSAVATAIKAGLELKDTEVGDAYTVSYDSTTDKFSIQKTAEAVATFIGWATYTGTDSAAKILGYTVEDSGSLIAAADVSDTTAAYINKFVIQGDGANTNDGTLEWNHASCTAETTLGFATVDDASIRTTSAVSDSAVAFNVVTGSNDAFNIRVDAEGPDAVTITAGAYTSATLVTEMDTEIDTASTSDVTVSYTHTTTNKFRITSDDTGAGSSISVTEGTNDFLKTVKLVGDVPVDGQEAAGVIAADHVIVFTATTAVAATGKVKIDFPSGFNLPTNLNFEDMDMAGSVFGEFTLVGTGLQVANEWGVTVTTGDGGDILFTSGGGTADIDAGETITIEIGRNATYAVAGVEQISNPTTVGLYQILVKTTTSGDVTIDDTYIGVYIVPDDSVVVTATVDPILSLALYGGTYVDFGTIEPNAFHKLGGARNAYGSITLTGVVVDGVLDADTVTVRGIVYEFSDDGVIAATSHAKVDIVDNENNYLTVVQVAANLYRAINNFDGALLRANVDPGDTDQVWIMAVQPGTGPNAWTITENVTPSAGDVAITDIANGTDGYNVKGGTILYAQGVDVGNGATGTNIVLSTNAAGGYVLTVQNTDSNAANNDADGLTNGVVEIPQWTTGTYGYGILASAQSARYGDGTGTIIGAAFQGDGVGDLPEQMSTTPFTLASYAGTTASDNIAVEYNIRIGIDQAAGLYTDTVTYILTSTF